MPTYEYKCNDCGHRFEFVQSMLENPLAICPQCDGHVQRVISRNVGISFKGAGFYVTDSRSTETKESASTVSESSSATPPSV